MSKYYTPTGPRPRCPHCSSQYVLRDGLIGLDQAYRRKKCRRGFVAADTRKPARVGSGVIAEPRRGSDFKALHRDPFAHMRLALITRH